MKKTILGFISAALLLTSCDIDRLPYGSMSSDQVDPENQFTELVNGGYAQLKDWSDPMHRCGEYAGDNICKDKHSTDAFFDFISFNRTANNGRLQTFWDYGWKAVAQASNVINMAKEGESDAVDYRLGECYYMRGLVYFYFVRAYGRPFYQAPDKNLGVPIVNGTPDDVTNLYLGDRATVRETYQQVIDDLTAAARLMDKGVSEGHDGPAYASKEAAWALLSRVYLYMSGTYEQPNAEYAQKAVDYANLVIGSNKYQLLPREQFMRYNEYTPENNAESIFVIKRVATEFSGYDHYYGIGGMYCYAGEMGWAEIFASAKYLDLLNETGRNDWRPGHKHIVDARANFIDPQYVQNEDGSYTEVFRFIKKVYDNTGAHSGYVYVQAPITRNGNTITCTEGDKTFTLQVVNADEEKYSVAYTDGSTYEGYIDYLMYDNVGHPQFYINKCSYEGVASGEQASQLYSPLISRLGEVYLNRAEAYAKLGEYGKAQIDLNTIRERSIPGAGYTDLSAANAKQRIEKERQLELAFQAERSYDVFRNGGTLTRAYPGIQDGLLQVPATDYRVIFYIPQNAINAYPGVLTQNPTSQADVILN